MFDTDDIRQLFDWGGLTLDDLFKTQETINELAERSREFRTALYAWLEYGDVFAEMLQATKMGEERHWRASPGWGIEEYFPG